MNNGKEPESKADVSYCSANPYQINNFACGSNKIVSLEPDRHSNAVLFDLLKNKKYVGISKKKMEPGALGPVLKVDNGFSVNSEKKDEVELFCRVWVDEANILVLD